MYGGVVLFAGAAERRIGAPRVSTCKKMRDVDRELQNRVEEMEVVGIARERRREREREKENRKRRRKEKEGETRSFNILQKKESERKAERRSEMGIRVWQRDGWMDGWMGRM